MKSNVNVFVGVVLCAVLCGTFVWLRSAGEEDTWKPNEIYDQVHSSSYGASYTNATFSGSPQDGGLAVSISSPSSMRARSTKFYAGAGYAPIASSPLVSSPMGAASGAGLYTTSSAEIKSFGGGGNGGAAMGGVARGNSVSNPSLQGGAGVGFVSSPIAYSTARRGEMSSTSGTNPAMMAQQGMTPDMASAGNFGYAAASNYLNASTYDQYNAIYGGNNNGRSNVRGKQNAGMADSWLDWLYRYGSGYGSKTGDENGWYYTFTQAQLWEAYNDYITNYWDDMWGAKKPSFDEWLAWLQNGGESGYEYNGNRYMWMPVGDILPLIFFALLYAVMVYVRRKPARKLNNSIVQ